MVKLNITSLRKTIAVITLVVTAFVFLSFGVSATTYNPTTYNSYTDAITISNVTYSLRVTQFKALSEGTSMLPGGMETIMFVQFQLTNDNNQDALCQIPVFSIDLSDERVITDVYTYAGDLALGVISTGFVIYPTQAFSYDASNKIVVPANSTLTLVGGIGLPAQLNQTGDGTLDTGLRNVHLLNKPYSVTLGSYSHGTPIDISPIEDYLDTIIDNQDTENLKLGDIVDVLTYSGNFYQHVGSVGTSLVLSKYFSTYIRGYANIFYGTPYLISIDQIVDGNTDANVTNGTMRYPVLIRSFVYNNSASQDKATTEAYNEISNFIPTGYVFHVQYFNSEVYGNVGITADGHLRFYPKNIDNNFQWILDSKHYYNTMLIGYVDVPVNMSLTWTSANINSFFSGSFTNINNAYNPPNEYTILRDLYLAYSEVNGLDDSSRISNDVADVSDSNHIIEESYYSANASAIEATGLSNYRFSNEQDNGIGKVSSDFMLLWNALGSWNGVYIFSLTMALATFIMRHRGMLPSRSKDDKGGGEE